MLNVIAVYYNYCNYKSRHQVSKKFIDKYQYHPNINLYLIELAYEEKEFVLTDKNNKNHLQLRTKNPLWHKENLINIGINKLLPENWNSIAWIDCNIEFENDDFIEKTLEKLQQYDFVQMFSTIKYKNSDNQIDTYYSFMYNNDLSSKPGGAWACTKIGYDKIGKLFDKSLCESDCILAHALKFKKSYYKKNNNNKNNKYLDCVSNYVDNIIKNNITVSYVNNIIIYFWHGNQENRNYHIFRKKMIIDLQYDPDSFFYDSDGVLIPNDNCDIQILDYIKKYFYDRKEDMI